MAREPNDNTPAEDMTRTRTSNADVVERKASPSFGVGVRWATVVAWEGGAEVRVRSARDGDAMATLGLASAYRPTPGDRVLIIGSDEGDFVIGVTSAHVRQIALADGGVVAVTDGSVTIADREGRVVVRYGSQ